MRQDLFEALVTSKSYQGECDSRLFLNWAQYFG